MRAMWESFVMALSSLRANKMRSLLTTLGIVIGITTIIAIVSIVEGLNDAFAAELDSIGQGVLYVQKFPWANNDWRKFRHHPDISMKEYDAIVSSGRLVNGASPMRYTRRTVKWKNRSMDLVQVSGVNSQYAMIRNVYPSKGRFFTPPDVEGGRPICLLGFDVAERLFGVRNPIGQRVRIGNNLFEVVGVMAKRGDFFDQNLDQFVLVPHTTFSKVIERGRQRFSIVVKVADATSIAAAKDELRGILRRVRKVPLNKPDNFAVNEVDVLRELYEKLTGSLYAAMFAVAGISLLVGGIGIMNIMLVSVTERTREIGIRKALGARRRWILMQFLFEAAVIASIGGVLGVLGGAGVAKLVASATPLPASVKMWSVVVGISFSSAVGLIFGFFPARAAAKKDPIEALGYE
ncbi:MAG: ABC transporter permease [Candidatus Lernaella stagnicola]|nr:ABC transporter permease [Candidatus Lernaella stagnicola]